MKKYINVLILLLNFNCVFISMENDKTTTNNYFNNVEDNQTQLDSINNNKEFKNQEFKKKKMIINRIMFTNSNAGYFSRYVQYSQPEIKELLEKIKNKIVIDSVKKILEIFYLPSLRDNHKERKKIIIKLIENFDPEATAKAMGFTIDKDAYEKLIFPEVNMYICIEILYVLMQNKINQEYIADLENEINGNKAAVNMHN